MATKTVTAPDGSRQTLATVDADSPTFSDDLTAVFRRNVARARRDNKRLTGAASGGKTWIVADANGSGKSTLYDRTDIEGFGRSVWIINPDTLSARIAQQEHMPLLAANGQALDRIWAWLEASIQAHQTVGVETVLSTDKYRALAGRAKALGFEIRLLYVFVRTADMNVARVKLRVEKGGHAVEESRIRARRERSFAQLPWFLD